MKPRASALSHLERYPSARPSTLRQKEKQDDTTAALRAEVSRINRQKRIDAIKRVLRWPAHVWRW